MEDQILKTNFIANFFSTTLIFGIFLGGIVSADTFFPDPKKFVNIISNRVVESLVSFARSTAEITYEDVRYDPNLEIFFVSGMRVVPFALETPKGCEVNLATISISGSGSLANSSKQKIEIGINDVIIDKFCMPIEMRGMMSLAGIDDIEIPTLKLEVSHRYDNAATVFSLFGGVAGSFEFVTRMEFDYFSITVDEEMPILARLNEAYIKIDNSGLWENLSGQIPDVVAESKLAGIAASQAIYQGLDGNVSQKIEENISQQVQDAVNIFVKEPGSLLLTTNIQENSNILLDGDFFADFDQAFEALNPTIKANGLVRRFAFDIEDVENILAGNFAQFDNSELTEYASAFYFGDGLPKSDKTAREIIDFLQSDRAYDGSTILLEIHLKQGLYEEAYLEAQRLSANSKLDVVSYFNKIEKELSLTKIISLQDSASYLDVKNQSHSSKNAYELSSRYLSGSGTIKSYLKSYFWALVALSKGDDRAQLTVEKIEKLSDKLSAEDGQNWAAELARVQNDALEYWISTR